MPTCKAQRHNRLTLLLRWISPQGSPQRPTPRFNPPSTMGPSTRWTPNLHNRVRHHPQLNWGLSSYKQPAQTSSKQSIQQWWFRFSQWKPQPRNPQANERGNQIALVEMKILAFSFDPPKINKFEWEVGEI